MKRLILLALTTLSIAAGAMLAPATSLAADSTCSTHALAFTAWGIADDHIDTSWHLQCGGANNEHWAAILSPQYKNSSGNWVTPTCENTQAPCQVSRPTSGDYAGGEDHSGTNTWNPAIQIDCRTWRFHATVVFYGSSPNIGFNSLTYQIGGC